MNQLTDLALSADHGLEELLWENRNVLARRLSADPSCSFRSPRAGTKSQTDIHRTRRPMLGAVDSILRDTCFSTKHNTALQHDDHGPELSLGLFDSHFGLFLDAEDITAHDEKHLREPHVVPVYKEGNPRTSNSSMFIDGFPELTTARNIGEPRQPSMETWAEPISKQPPRESRTPAPLTGLADSKLQKVNSGPDKCLTSPNFSFFLRSAALGKGNSLVAGATRPTSGSSRLVPEQSKSHCMKPAEGGDDLFELPLMEKSSDSKNLKGFQKRVVPEATTLEPISPVTKPTELSTPPDEQSEALVPKCFTKRKHWPDQVPGLASGLPEHTIKGKPDAGKRVDQDAATTSSCSRGASNDVKSLKKRCECTERMACRNEDIKKQAANKRTQKPGRGSAGAKKGTKEGHKLSERRRRDKINKKISKLQKLIPYCDKEDKASILDEAIRYLKALQLQVQIMSMGTGLICMPPMMLPTGMQPIQAPHSAHFSPMGLRMNLGFGYNTTPFSTSPFLGLQGRMMQKSVPIAPFIPFNEGYFANIPGRATSEELHASAPFSSSNNVAPGDHKLCRM